MIKPLDLPKSPERGLSKAAGRQETKPMRLALPTFSAVLFSLSCFTTSSQAVVPSVSPRIPHALIQRLIKEINHNDRNFRLSDGDLRILNDHIKCRLIDLNGDGIAEFFLYIDHSDWCGAGTNCDYWVFQETRGGYKLLLNDKQLRATRTVTNGYRDLVSEKPMGVISPTELRFQKTVYKFQRQQYRAVSSSLETRVGRRKARE